MEDAGFIIGGYVFSIQTMRVGADRELEKILAEDDRLRRVKPD